MYRYKQYDYAYLKFLEKWVSVLSEFQSVENLYKNRCTLTQGDVYLPPTEITETTIDWLYDLMYNQFNKNDS